LSVRSQGGDATAQKWVLEWDFQHTRGKIDFSQFPTDFEESLFSAIYSISIAKKSTSENIS